MRLKFLDIPWAATPSWRLGPLTHPVDAWLTASVRRVARARPDVFRRLGRFQHSVFLIVPEDLPCAFRLSPAGERATVEIVGKRHPGPCAVRIGGRMRTLLGLFDGSIDADASFFSRALRVEGATEAALALHNALEAAELHAGDILGLPAVLKTPLDRLLQAMGPRSAT